jgi:hypothetical protein
MGEFQFQGKGGEFRVTLHSPVPLPEIETPPLLALSLYVIGVCYIIYTTNEAVDKSHQVNIPSGASSIRILIPIVQAQG